VSAEKEKAWIIAGYSLIAEHGFKAVNIQLLSRTVQKSKSSFYHYFTDTANYYMRVMAHHVERSQVFVDDIATIQNIEPDLIDILMNYRDDILFHKQLHLNYHQEACASCIQKVNTIYEKTLIEKWIPYLGLEHKRLFLQSFHRFMIEHFCLKISADHYSREWIQAYLKDMVYLLQQMKAG